MRVDLDINLDKDVSSTIKSAILHPPKLALGKISSVTFCKQAQITKKNDNFRQVLSPFDINLE